MRRDGLAFELLLPGDRRVRLGETATIGRAPHNTVTLDDPSVSRTHARIFAHDGDVLIEDAASSYGTWVDGRELDGPRPLRDGARIRVGDTELVFERRRPDYLSGRTRVVRPARDPGRLTGVTPEGCPSVRPGWALKRLDADEGTRRFVLRDLAGGGYLRLGADDAALFERLDGRTSLARLREDARERFGPYGEFRLLALISDLSEAGLLQDGRAAPAPRGSRAAALLRPRELATDRLGGAIEALYRRGGWLLFTRPALVLLAGLVAVGAPVFAAELLAGRSTPLLVADSVPLAALALLASRLALVAAHELAHGFTLAAIGRSVSRGGMRFLLIFPYAFLDTSEAWLEPRRHRVAVSAAGPASDLAAGGLAALLCAALGGVAGEVALQGAITAYLSAFFNLHPLLPRDGYHIVTDLLRRPDLRRRAQETMARRIAGAGRDESRLLRAYGACALLWTAIGIAWSAASLERARPRLEPALGRSGTTALVVVAGVLLASPLAVTYGPAAAARLRRSRARHGR